MLMVWGVQEAEDVGKYFNSALSSSVVSSALFHSLQPSLFGFVLNRIGD